MKTLSNFRDQLSAEIEKNEKEAAHLLDTAKKLRAVMVSLSTLNGRAVSEVHIHTTRHRRKCVKCGRGFLAKHKDAMFCHNPCQSHDRNFRRGSKKGKGARRDKRGHLLTPGRLAAMAKARATLAQKRAEAKREAARIAHRGKTLIPGDPLRPSSLTSDSNPS